MKRLQRHRATVVNKVSGRSASQALRSGFTLLEVMLVMAILIVLAGISASFLLNASDDAMDDIARTKALEIQGICKRYKIKTGKFPTSPTDLFQRPADVSPNKWRRPFVESEPLDPWNNPFKFTRTENANIIHVVSAGVDGQFETADDISTQNK